MEVHTAGLAHTLEAKGHEISIIEVGSNLYVQERFGQMDNIKISTLTTVQSLRSPGVFESLKIIRKQRGDVCIFPKGDIYAGSWQLDLVARLRFSYYITIEHKASLPLPPKSSRRHLGGLLPGVGLWWYKAKLNFFLRSLWPQQVICVSDNVAKGLIDYNGFPQHKVISICNGIDPEIFQALSDHRTTTRKTWGIPENALVFGSIGRLHPWKGFDLALELFVDLISSAPSRDVWFVLVGNGPEQEALKRMAQERDFKGRVLFYEFTDKPWEIYPAIDVFLMPSLMEGLPLSLLEAMACGCCPIAMGVGGIPEVITDPGLGWLVRPNDKLGFFKAMQEAAEIPPVRLEEMGRKIREHIVLNFDSRRQFLALADLIEKACVGI